ncbi:sensor histidine kinase [Hyphomonas chukchiensis]|uniref:histidine kinase n=1 Tax=Hyphomonas chukchiensis TaxID=1280947 RepID=A0A062UG00_9PROT|nr:sensor histidine kinase [Hyphomonas chukchiensis]KCZ60893.1 hypothetical protein HY30_00740 [Hyphomonas chukchiensis]
MHFSWANSQVGISAGAIGTKTPRLGRIGKLELFQLSQLRVELEKSHEQILHLEALLREADHRIKNSLQVASSLLKAEARRSVSDELRDALISAASRVSAISMVHDALQGSGGESLLDVSHLMERMCHSMQDLCEGKAEIHLDLGETLPALPVIFARPLMLLVNEIIMNALRHAFPPDRLGTISVSLERDGHDIIVVVKDDGVGMTITEAGHAGFGTRLIEMMTRQIDGELVRDITSGTCFTLTAPLP